MKGRHSAANTQTPFSSRLVFSVLVCCRRCAEPDADSYRRLDQFSHMVSVVCGLEKGLFREQGLELLPVYMQARISLAALASKQIGYITQTGSSLTAIARGLPA